MLLIASLRHWIAAAADPEASSWLRALRDPQIARVIALLHDRPADPWTVDTIARGVGYTSEFAFNRAFARHRGQPPGRYRRSAHTAPAGDAPV